VQRCRGGTVECVSVVSLETGGPRISGGKAAVEEVSNDATLLRYHCYRQNPRQWKTECAKARRGAQSAR